MKEKMFDFKAAVRDAVRQAQAERSRGEWMWSADEDGESWICSECMEEFTTDDVGNFPKWAHFCPNCGAEMRAMNMLADDEDDV